jgi:hypothetical protein
MSAPGMQPPMGPPMGPQYGPQGDTLPYRQFSVQGDPIPPHGSNVHGGPVPPEFMRNGVDGDPVPFTSGASFADVIAPPAPLEGSNPFALSSGSAIEVGRGAVARHAQVEAASPQTEAPLSFLEIVRKYELEGLLTGPDATVTPSVDSPASLALAVERADAQQARDQADRILIEARARSVETTPKKEPSPGELFARELTRIAETENGRRFIDEAARIIEEQDSRIVFSRHPEPQPTAVPPFLLSELPPPKKDDSYIRIVFP